MSGLTGGNRRIVPIAVIAGVLLIAASSADAKSWRLRGGKRVEGEYTRVEGTTVIVKASDGTEKKLDYAELSVLDRTFVRQKLQAAGKDDVATRLEESTRISTREMENSSGFTDAQKEAEERRQELLRKQREAAEKARREREARQKEQEAAAANSGFPSGLFGAGAAEQGAASAESLTREWTDITGNRVTAKLVSIDGLNITLETNGEQQSFPISNFSVADQTWINRVGRRLLTPQTPAGAGRGPGGFPSGGFGGPSRMNRPPGAGAGIPTGPPGFGGGAPSMPTGPTMPPSGFGSSGSGIPGSSLPESAMPNRPAGSMTSQPPGMGLPGSGGPDMSPGSGPGGGFGPSDFGQPPDIEWQDPSANLPVWEFDCPVCGTNYTKNVSISTPAIDCPVCSKNSAAGGSGFTSSDTGGGGVRVRSWGKIVKGVIAIVALVVAGVGALIRKLTGSNG